MRIINSKNNNNKSASVKASAMEELMKYQTDPTSISTGQVLDNINNIKTGDIVYFNDEKNGRSGYYIVKGITPVLENNDNVFFYYSTNGGHFNCSHLNKGDNNE